MELKVASRTITDESGTSRQFHYSILIEQVESEHFFCEHYGVLISEEHGEQIYIPGITTSAARIDELMTLLIQHTVSPTTLPDIVADWL